MNWPSIKKIIISGSVICSFISGIALFDIETSYLNFPHNPQESRGRLHPYPVKNSIVYITDKELTKISIIKGSFFAFLLIAISVSLVMGRRQKLNSRIHYQSFDPSPGFPAGTGLFYECNVCGDAIPSAPETNTHCKCRNIMIDVDHGRIKIREVDNVKLFTLSP